VLQYSNTQQLTHALLNIHSFYDGTLNGKLKGINFSTHVYLDYKQLHNVQNEAEHYIDQLLSHTTHTAETKDTVETKDTAQENTRDTKDTAQENTRDTKDTAQENTRDVDYCIACVKGDKSTLLHEWAHAVYYFNTDYKQLVSTAFNSLDSKLQKIIHNDLQLRNYNHIHVLDEFQAYLCESPADFGNRHATVLYPLHVQFKQAVGFPLLQ
jgi:hypothetical protein